jgi:hypothetical protein
MKKRAIITVLLLALISVQAFAYRMVTVAYNGNYEMDCYIPSSFQGCPNPNDSDSLFFACGPSNATILVLMHGGFFEFGSRHSMTPYAVGFAQLENMIILNIDYRKGWGFNPSQPCNGNNTALQTAVYRVAQDANKAINYFITNCGQRTFGIANPEKYTWNVFGGGYSAGAVTAINLHATQAEWDTEIPLVTEQEGGVNHNPGLYTFQGCFSIGGGAANLTYIKSGTYNVFFHGQNDATMPYWYGYPVNPNCTNYTPTYGGGAIYHYIDSTGIANAKLYTKPGGHGAFASTQADVAFVVNKFISSISATCFLMSCGDAPGPPFYIGTNCPGLMPANWNVQSIPLPLSVTESISLNFNCPMPARLAHSNTDTDLNTFLQSNQINQIAIYGMDGRLLLRNQFNMGEILDQYIDESMRNQMLVIEFTTNNGLVRRFKYISIK